MSVNEGDLEATIRRIKDMNEKNADRLDLLSNIKNLTFYINNVTGSWLNMFNNPSMSKISREDLSDIFTLQRETALKLLNMAIEFNKKTLEQNRKLLSEVSVV
jgi:hypothetical protein